MGLHRFPMVGLTGRSAYQAGGSGGHPRGDLLVNDPSTVPALPCRPSSRPGVVGVASADGGAGFHADQLRTNFANANY